MAKWQIDAMLDAALAYISGNATQLYVCSGQPANYAAIAGVALTGAVVPSFTGPANGDVSGRKLTVDEEADIPVTASGTATHVVLASGSVLLYVTTTTSQAITAGNTVTVPAWKIEIADAT
jgi:hypothetical protein